MESAVTSGSFFRIYHIRDMKPDYLTSSFLQLRDRLHRSALRFLKNDEDARDALQDTFSRLWNHPPAETDAEARNKLFAVLRNICIDRLRERRTISLDDSEEAMHITVPPDDGDTTADLEHLLTTGLTAIQHRIFNLVVHEGREYDEIAQLLDMSVEAVRMNMSRARKRIKENYKRLNR